MFIFNCPYCKLSLEAENEWSGMILQCPNCNNNIIVQQNAQPVANENYFLITICVVVFLFGTWLLTTIYHNRQQASSKKSVPQYVSQHYIDGRNAGLSGSDRGEGYRIMSKSPEEIDEYIRGLESTVNK